MSNTFSVPSSRNEIEPIWMPIAFAGAGGCAFPCAARVPATAPCKNDRRSINELGNFVFGDEVRLNFAAHTGRLGGEHFAVDNFLFAARFHVDGVRNCAENVQVGGPAAVTCQLDAEAVG